MKAVERKEVGCILRACFCSCLPFRPKRNVTKKESFVILWILFIFTDFKGFSALTEVKGAAMSSTATESGLVIFVLSLTVVQGQFDWEVTHSSHQICAFKGSTVDIPCTYTYPSSWNEHDVVFKPFWFRGMNGNNPFDLSSDPDFSGRVEYLFKQNDCTLRIKDLRERDSAEYKFTLRTNKPDPSWTESPGVSLSITDPDLHVMVNNLTDYQSQTRAELRCHSSCHLPAHLSYIWYRNGRATTTVTSSFSGEVYPADSFACALKGHEGFPSPAVCVQGENCNRVTYTDRGICAVEGSSVDISCAYNSYGTITSKFWFSPERSQQWRFPVRPEDLREDPQFSGRVQVIETERGHSTLRIVDLRLSDSAQYHFKFKTKSVEWISVLPATTLTVTALQVLVNITSVKWSLGSAELRCHSSCSPAGQPSYIWFKNGEKIQTETSSFKTHFDSSDSYACALKRYEDFPSAPVCVYSRSCNTVVYEKRRICALKGSTVDILCMQFSYRDPNSSFWFSPARSHHWQDQTQPEDLREDSQYAYRALVFATQSGRSTLRISDLRESDSAEYRFRFTSGHFGWGSDFPGSTLTVTALQVRVTAVTVHQDYTEAALTCHNSCSPAGRVSYIWFKNGQRIPHEEDSSLEYWFHPGDSISCAVRGLEKSSSPSLYALKVPSVWISPPGDLTEGLSVNLTCSTDAIIEAKFTWYRRNQTLLREDPQLILSSIQSSDSGEYYCAAENELGKKTSEPVFIDVKYAPKLPSVSVSPSGAIAEGTSINLSCSSDANPAANYTWYKEDDDSPKASGPNFIITESRPEHSGNYYCEAQNGMGSTNSSLGLLVVAGAWRSPAGGIALGAVLAVLLLVVFILMRRKTASQRSHEIGEGANENQEQFQTTQITQEEQATLHYASVRFITHPTDSLYSNIRPGQHHSQEPEEDGGVEYAAITFHNGSSAPRGAASLRGTSS